MFTDKKYVSELLAGLAHLSFKGFSSNTLFSFTIFCRKDSTSKKSTDYSNLIFSKELCDFLIDIGCCTKCTDEIAKEVIENSKLSKEDKLRVNQVYNSVISSG